ncbi:MAG TPA: hypothetical protein DDX14_06055, partial [Cyanobacteria bacterium UBA9579]|nr:hypothetical protein [Cyanobacteria bacterium UBA9579]
MNTTLNVGLNLNPYKKNQQAGSTQSLPKDNLLSGNKSLTTDTINFSSNKNVIHNNRLSFTGIVPAQKEIDAYLDDYAGYKKIADMNNNVLASFVDPANAREISRIGEKSGKTREQLLGEVSDNMVMAYNQLKDSNVIVVNGIKPAKVDFLDNNKYTQVKNIYLNLLDRPETFKRVAFDAEDHQLETILSEEDIEEHTRDFKHIVNDILPEILNSKTLVLSNSANLKDILSDEVVQGIIIDKLYEEISGNNEEEKSLENLNIAEKKMHTAMHILHDIDSKFNITTVSEVPGRFYDPLAKEGLKPKENYNPKYFNLRQEPKNFYEAKFLNNAAKDIKSYNPETTIIVTPKSAANDIIEKVKTINKDYLFIEDWLYKYSLGDQKAKDEVLEKLNKAADGKFVSEFKSIANELDNYLNNYIQVYDTENPENNSKLTGMMKQFGKVNS